MSTQCWCFHCAGRIVTRTTFIKHGRKVKPDAPVLEEADQPLELDPPLAPMEMEGDREVASLPPPAREVREDDHPPELAEALKDLNVRSSNAVGGSGITAMDVSILLLDWMHTNKQTGNSAHHIWGLCRLLVPEGALPSFDVVKKLLSDVESGYCKRIDSCPNDCVLFCDLHHLPEPYRNSHRTRCPKCNAKRVLVDPQDGRSRPAKTVFFFPVAPFIKGLFARPDLVPFLYNDTEDGRPRGHVTRSRGWKTKIRDNPHMSEDHRNLGLVGGTDGVPFFGDQRRSGWPYVLRVANLPDRLSMHMSNVHLHLLSASEHWELQSKAGLLKRIVRGPKTLKAHLSVIVDDLRAAYLRGVRCHDASIPRGVAGTTSMVLLTQTPSRAHTLGRAFKCKTLLLFWCGDYPAQAKVSGTHDKCCHWCKYKSEKGIHINRRLWKSFRRYLPEGHHLREASGFHGPACREAPPEPRTHQEFASLGTANEVHMEKVVKKLRPRVFKKDAPYKDSGIHSSCPLRWIFMFDLVWDILPDMMHIIWGIWHRHLLQVWRGNRAPSGVKPAPKKRTKAEHEELVMQNKRVKENLGTWRLSKVHRTYSQNCRYYVLFHVLFHVLDHPPFRRRARSCWTGGPLRYQASLPGSVVDCGCSQRARISTRTTGSSLYSPQVTTSCAACTPITRVTKAPSCNCARCATC